MRTPIRTYFVPMWLAAFMASVLIFGGAALAPAAAARSVATQTESSQVYIAKINALRASKGLPALYSLVELNESATNKANHMAAQNYWGHYAPDDTSFKDFIWQSAPNAQFIGENLARCFTTRDAAFAALLASPTHYEIMVGEFRYVGVAEVYDADLNCTLTVIHFANM